MTDVWSDRLSDLLNGDLSPQEAEAAKAHLATCGACRSELDELRAVKDWARDYRPGPPRSDPWPVIAERIEHRPRRWPVPFRSSPALAAAAVIALAVLGGVWFVLSRPATGEAEGGASGQVTFASISLEADYAPAVAELQRILSDRRDRLDAETLAILERSLQAIDEAIQQVREALADDPDNALLHDLFARSMRQKVGLMRDVATWTLLKS